MIGISNVPFIPFIHNSEDVIFFFYVLIRVGGFFSIAPVISSKVQTSLFKTLLSVLTAVLLTMALYSDYRGPQAIYEIPEFYLKHQFSAILFIATAIKEFATGFFLGFCFSILTEAISIAGQLVSQLMGLSMAEMFDPLTNSSQPLLGQFFMTIATLLIFTWDFHHIFWRVLTSSFNFIPIGHFHLRHDLLQIIASGSAQIYPFGLQLAIIPYVVLLLVTLALAFLAKVMPEMNIFMVGIPLKLYVGFYTLMMACSNFPTVLKRLFLAYENLARLVIYYLANRPT